MYMLKYIKEDYKTRNDFTRYFYQHYLIYLFPEEKEIFQRTEPG